ncbi:hypothetical protein TNCV_2755671 [Trichonephila clavipes]|nr:hypothetical protein TNCV_2755671 [Trichonephila clavipes]
MASSAKEQKVQDKKKWHVDPERFASPAINITTAIGNGSRNFEHRSSEKDEILVSTSSPNYHKNRWTLSLARFHVHCLPLQGTS